MDIAIPQALSPPTRWIPGAGADHVLWNIQFQIQQYSVSPPKFPQTPKWQMYRSRSLWEDSVLTSFSSLLCSPSGSTHLLISTNYKPVKPFRKCPNPLLKAIHTFLQTECLIHVLIGQGRGSRKPAHALRESQGDHALMQRSPGNPGLDQNKTESALQKSLQCL